MTLDALVNVLVVTNAFLALVFSGKWRRQRAATEQAEKKLAESVAQCKTLDARVDALSREMDDAKEFAAHQRELRKEAMSASLDNEPLPLGMSPRFSSSLRRGDIRLLEALEVWPLEFLTPKVMETGLFESEDSLAEYLLAYRRFLFFKGRFHHPRRDYDPDRLWGMYSERADAIWHTHILHTRAYAEFCTEVVGRFIHHTPCSMLGDPKHYARQWQHWRYYYEQAFESLPSDFDHEGFPGNLACG
ncbi:MAG: hypothetical protein AAF184_05910 [Pseudomonadota bacterium]